MSEHTPEPWEIQDRNENGDIYIGPGDWPNSGHPPYVAIICADPVSLRLPAGANARRIVACVNACAGVEDSLLEGDNAVSFSATAARLARAEALLREARAGVFAALAQGTPISAGVQDYISRVVAFLAENEVQP